MNVQGSVSFSETSITSTVIAGYGFGARQSGRVGQDYARYAAHNIEGLKPFYGFPVGNAFKGGGGAEIGGSKIFAEVDCLSVLISTVLKLLSEK
jgi:hypothetical protein